MARWQKIAATVWTTLLVAPFLYLFFAYARLECGEYDPCPTGGAMPYAWAAAALLFVVAALQAAFLLMIWRSGPGRGD
jgi:hypothetical protein